MENLNAEQIKEDIDNCIEGECELCSYYDQTACKEHLMHAALALITSQEQRIKELAEKNEKLSKAFNDLWKEAETYLKQRDALQNRVKYLEKNNNERQTDA